MINASKDFIDRNKKNLAWQAVNQKTSFPSCKSQTTCICNKGFFSTRFQQCSLVYMTDKTLKTSKKATQK